MNITDMHDMIADVGKKRGEQAALGRIIDDIMHDNPEYLRRFPKDAIDVATEEQEAWEEAEYQSLCDVHHDKHGI